MDLDLAAKEASSAAGGVTRGVGQGGRSQNPKAVAVIILLFVLVVGSYTLGQFGRDAGVREAADETPTPEPTALPTPEPVVVRPLISDLLGPGRVVGGLGLGHGNQVLVFCRHVEPTSGLAPSLVVAHAGQRQGLDYLISYTEVATPAGGPESCRACAPLRQTLGGETVLTGTCDNGDGTSTAYVIAANEQFWLSPVAMVARCHDRITLVATEEHLVLASPRVTITLERVGGRFLADDLAGFGSECDVGGSKQLGTPEPTVSALRPELGE